MPPSGRWSPSGRRSVSRSTLIVGDARPVSRHRSERRRSRRSPFPRRRGTREAGWPGERFSTATPGRRHSLPERKAARRQRSTSSDHAQWIGKFRGAGRIKPAGPPDPERRTLREAMVPPRVEVGSTKASCTSVSPDVSVTRSICSMSRRSPASFVAASLVTHTTSASPNRRR